METKKKKKKRKNLKRRKKTKEKEATKTTTNNNKKGVLRTRYICIADEVAPLLLTPLADDAGTTAVGPAGPAGTAAEDLTRPCVTISPRREAFTFAARACHF